MPNRAFQRDTRISATHEAEEASVTVSKDPKYKKSKEALKGLAGKTYKDRYKLESLESFEIVSMVFKSLDTKTDNQVSLTAPCFFQPEIMASFQKAGKRFLSVQNDLENTLVIEDVFQPFMVEERPIQPTLERLLNNGKTFTLIESVEILQALCKSVQSAHQESILHGRISPKSVVVFKKKGSYSAKLGGYGFCEIQTILAKNELIEHSSPYISEHIYNDKCTKPDDDIYSLAVIGYKMISGKLPLVSGTQSSSAKQYDSLSRFCSNQESKKALDSLMKKGLRIGVEENYKTVDEFMDDLAALLESLDAGESKEESKLQSDEAEVLSKLEKLSDSITSKKSEKEMLTKDFSLEAFLDSNTDTSSKTNKKAKTEDENQIEIEKLEYSDYSNIIEEKEEIKTAKVGDIVLEQFVLLEVISSKDLCSVFLAKDLAVDRLVAIKCLNNPTKGRVEWFEKSIEAISNLNHESLPEFIDFQVQDGTPFYIMEHIDAPALDKLLEEIKSIETEEQIASAAIQICEALDFLHENGTYHGNITSDNVMLKEEEGDVRIVLCGLGTNILNEEEEKVSKDFDRALFKSTMQWQSVMNSSQKDIYEATALIYQLTTGNLPFENVGAESLSNDSKEAQSISVVRSDIFGVELLDNLLKKGFDVKSDDFFKSIRDLKIGVKSWIDQAYGELDFSVPEEEKENEVNSEWLTAGEAKSLEQLQEEMRKSQVLKANQTKVENTLAMQFTKNVSTSGRRKSPIRTVLEITGMIIFSGIAIYFVADYGVNNYESLKTKFVTASRGLSSAVYKTKNTSTENQEMVAFDYRQDPVYKRWTNAKVVGEARRILPEGKLRKK